MVTYLCTTPDRDAKTLRIMESLKLGWPDTEIVTGSPPEDDNPFAVWGQMWTAAEAIPKALAQGRNFFNIDNGYWWPSRGTRLGYYRITYNSPSPIYIEDAPVSRVDRHFRDWRKDGKHILIAMPGANFGRLFGLDMGVWMKSIHDEVRKYTDRPIRIREKSIYKPLAPDLRGCWALVTHSSNVAVDSILSGVPVFVAPSSPAAPVGSTDLSEIERPVMTDRKPWWKSLIYQQYTHDEMESGFAREAVSEVVRRFK